MPEVEIPSELDTEDYYETGGDGAVSMKGGQDDGDHVNIHVGLEFDGFSDYSNLTTVKFRFVHSPTFDTAARLIVYRPQSFRDIDITVRHRRRSVLDELQFPSLEVAPTAF